MLPGDKQAMSRKQRPMIEESQQLLILEDDRGRVSSGGNLAKEATSRHFLIMRYDG